MGFKDFLNEFSLRTENIKINHPLLGVNFIENNILSNSFKIKSIDNFNIFLKDDDPGVIFLVDNKNIVKGYIVFKHTIFKIKGKKIVSVYVSILDKTVIGKGLGLALYEELIKIYNVTNDEKNNNNSIKIWQKLANKNNLSLHIFDLEDGSFSNDISKHPNLEELIWTTDKNSYKAKNNRVLVMEK